jgi:UDP-N-acetylmuramoyl-L-alanyl-D-glutamate--2,6-diaminopimelate ligase
VSEAVTDTDERVESLTRWLRATLAPGAALVPDSRMVRPGDAFVAVAGRATDGRDHIGQAIEAGAAAVLYEAGDLAVLPAVPHRGVEGLRALAGPLGAAWYGDPSSHLKIVAVTGTNGKTTCTQWIARGLAESGRKTAVIGTLGSGLVVANPQVTMLESFGLTTPDAISLQRMLAGFVAAGVEVVAMEASSIGIEQGRLDGARIDVAVLTNFSRDHLDYHGDEASYLAQKLRLLSWPGLSTAIINGDDPVAPAALESVAAGVTTVAFGLQPGEHGWRATRKLAAWQIVDGVDAMSVSMGGDFGRAEVELAVLGRFNVVNATAVAATWLALGMSFDEAMLRLRALRPIPGRMQRLEVPGAPLVVVDFAHTPEALTNVLQALRPVASVRGGQLWCVFGAGGDRDSGKRPLMGMAAERGADRLVITSDNPRSETAFRIAADIRAGLSREPWLTELDRREAIRRSLEGASSVDVVLIAGKGHESYQEIAGVRYPFSDLAVARELLDERRRSGEDAGV